MALRVLSVLAVLSQCLAAPSTFKDVPLRSSRSTLFSSMPGGKPTNDVETCNATQPAFLPTAVAELNKVFDQLTVAEQVSIQDYMVEKYGIKTAAYEKCNDLTCHTIAKMVLVKPPKAQVMAYMAGTAPKPPRVAELWYLNGQKRSATLMTLTLPLTTATQPTVVREEPWINRPFVAWDDVDGQNLTAVLSVLDPIFTDMLSSVKISPELLAAAEAEDGDTVYPYVSYYGNGLSVPGSTPAMRKMLGATMIIAGPEDGWTMGMFKAGPLTFVYYWDYEAETLVVEDLVLCPGAGNPTFPSTQAMIDAFNAGTLKTCAIDGEFYGSTKEYMDPAEPYFADAESLGKAEPRIYYPDGPRFSVSGRTVSWMGWDFHADINGLNGMHISNLRFQKEMIVYEMHATEFSAVYSGVSSKKDLYYSDGGYEMGNCATTLKPGLQCPEEAIFLPNLGYDSNYVWGDELTLEAENPYAMCVFEAPDNKALFQHAQMRYEGLPQTALYVRTVLTVGNYDYTQTLKLRLDGDFELNKELSGYAVGSYHIPDAVKMDLYGSYISKSSIGALHTHSATYKVDIDVGSGGNGVKVKEFKYGPIADSVPPDFDLTGVKTASPSSYYYTTEYIKTEGAWDNDGDAVWTPPTACLKVNANKKFIVYSTDETNNMGANRGIMVDIPVSPTQMLPEGDPYLHLQNFTKCDLAITKYNTADKSSMSMDVFGVLHPRPAADGEDISHFFDNESIDGEDLVLHIHTTKAHYVISEDLPVPSTMGKPIVFEPYNYFLDGLNPVKHLPGNIVKAEPCIAS